MGATSPRRTPQPRTNVSMQAQHHPAVVNAKLR